ncbi:hypothetical protein C8Q73DRAFT_665853 [Cubamyces lactineus]|nr:hypothetical protein C8Q73DRAFT_665853 [Cubamyces lactineus]
MSQSQGRSSAGPARSDLPPPQHNINLAMHDHEAPISWYTPNPAGAQYSNCLLCRVVHVGRISHSEGNAPILMLQDFPEAMFAHSPGSVGQTPAELANTHVVCVQGHAPNLQSTPIAGVFRLPPPTSLPENTTAASTSTSTLASTSTSRNVRSLPVPPALSLTLPKDTQSSRRGSQAPDTPATPTGFGFSSGENSPASETDVSTSTGPNSPRTPLSAREYGMIVSALMQRAGSAAPASAPPSQRSQQTRQTKRTQGSLQEANRTLSSSRPSNAALVSDSPARQKRHKQQEQQQQQENAVASSSKAVQEREVIDVDADEDEDEQQHENESFGVPYVLLGLPDPNQPPPPTLTARLERARLALEANQLARRSPELPQRAAHVWVPALRRFLEVQRCAPDARPGRADVKACVGAVLGALRELEARRDALSYEALLKTRLYHTVKELADANRNTEKLQVSDRARKLIEHWNVYLPGIRVLAKDL